VWKIYEDRAVTYFDTDNYDHDTEFAEVINNQKIWYAYLRRLKSVKYMDKCPVTYSTVKDLG
jgi:hypothetical protein